ncbi:hypothetical protein DdX_01744 [Ditylenchus destructor]|uniref:Mitochondrial nucleoid factor 1 n=1 Tax=Ditylenchus destructor TaxID=166010 RepID=A0AAD4RDX6_9BILA|nr:hypothetical protein DdX_01744 [Ditylenchus destructor]
MAHLYKQYCRLLSKWPLDTKKSNDRNLKIFLEKAVEKSFTVDPVDNEKKLVSSEDSRLCSRKLQALKSLLDDEFNRAYPHKYKTGQFGLTSEQMRELNSEEGFKQIGLGPKKSFFARLFGK